jgi:hypothetical protein
VNGVTVDLSSHRREIHFKEIIVLRNLKIQLRHCSHWLDGLLFGDSWVLSSQSSNHGQPNAFTT